MRPDEENIVTRIAWSAIAACLMVSVVVFAVDETPKLKVPTGFTVTRIAEIDRARELAVAPNGDLLVGTSGGDVMIVPQAEGAPQPPHVFVHIGDAPAAGVALSSNALFVGSLFGIWKVPYHTGDLTAKRPAVRIAKVRTSGEARGHVTTSVTVAGHSLFASVGSSCDACDPELDATRATVQEMNLDGSQMHARSVRIRNAVALATNPGTQQVWAIPNGQDRLEAGHPYEIADPILTHGKTADYGWPHCFENRRKVDAKADCSKVAVPRVIFPAYNAPIGAAIYSQHPSGKFAFPAAYRGGLFVGLHGSWHMPLVPPRVAFVALEGDTPKTPVNWNDPTTQWQEFLSGFQDQQGKRIGRPTGIAVGPEGSLFVADDFAGAVYRIRPK